MNVHKAIQHAETLLPGEPAPEGQQDARWQAVIATGDFNPYSAASGVGIHSSLGMPSTEGPAGCDSHVLVRAFTGVSFRNLLSTG